MFNKVYVFTTAFPLVKARRRSPSSTWNLYFFGVCRDSIVTNYLSNLMEIGHLCKIALGIYVRGIEKNVCHMGPAFGGFWSKPRS